MASHEDYPYNSYRAIPLHPIGNPAESPQGGYPYDNEYQPYRQSSEVEDFSYPRDDSTQGGDDDDISYKGDMNLGSNESFTSIENHEEKQAVQERKQGKSSSTLPSSSRHNKNEFERSLLRSHRIPTMNSNEYVTKAIAKLTATADEEHWQTYENGEPSEENDKDAETVDVAIHYISGSSLAEVILIENQETSNRAAVEKSAAWKVLTAGDLLKEPDVGRDLKIKNVDITAKVLQKHRERMRLRGANSSLSGMLKSQNSNRVNIHSNHVHIVNSFSRDQGYDHKSHCIELDGTSLVSLIFNFRALLTQKGKDAQLSSEDTTRVLETMVEDARRLLVRSPILSRVAPRVVIQQSKNTRYGTDDGTSFRTLTTSKGIAEIITVGLSQYSTLQNSDAQKHIRPKMMQMLVLLLALLNDDDLETVRGTLEKNYNFQTDRRSVELSIMKVLTLTAVGPWQFITSITSNIGSSTHVEDTEEKKAEAWDNFLTEIARNGWIVAGSMTQLAEYQQKYQKKGSWKLKWEQHTNTDILDMLQYGREKGEINKIPPLKTGVDVELTEVVVDLSNNSTCKLLAKDLDAITIGRAGTYTVIDPHTGLNSDMIVESEVLFPEVRMAAKDLAIICSEVNERVGEAGDEASEQTRASWSSSQGSSVLSRSRFNPKRLSGGGKTQKSRSQRERVYFEGPQLPGYRERVVVNLGSSPRQESANGFSNQNSHQEGDELAISWMLEGKRISFNSLLDGVLTDLRSLGSLVSRIREWAQRSASAQGHLVRELIAQLDKVQKLIEKGEVARKQLQVSPPDNTDEPIARVHFEHQIHHTQEAPWCHYELGSLPTPDFCFAVDSERYIVKMEPSWTGNVATLHLGDTVQVKATPLGPIPEAEKEYEVAKDDTVLLLGFFMAVIPAPESAQAGDAGTSDEIVNFMRLTSVHRVLGTGRQAKLRALRGGPILQQTVLA